MTLVLSSLGKYASLRHVLILTHTHDHTSCRWPEFDIADMCNQHGETCVDASTMKQCITSATGLYLQRGMIDFWNVQCFLITGLIILRLMIIIIVPSVGVILSKILKWNFMADSSEHCKIYNGTMTLQFLCQLLCTL